jgi:hypothetical protein
MATAEEGGAAAEVQRIIKKAVLLLDGEFNQMKASMTPGGIGHQAKEADIGLWKLAAACSSTQQPNDVMKAFAILKAFFRNSKSRNMDPAKMPRPPYWRQLQKILENVPAASRRTFEKYFLCLPIIADTAFSVSCVANRWYKAWVCTPPNVKHILLNCPPMRDSITPEQFEEVVASVYTIAASGIQRSQFGEGGGIPDELMELHLEKFFGKALDLQQSQTPVHLRPFNYWRCLEIMGDSTIAEYSRRHAAAEAVLRELEEAKAEAAQKRRKKAEGRTCLCACAQFFGYKAKIRPVDAEAAGWKRCDSGNCKKPFCLDCAVAQGR